MICPQRNCTSTKRLAHGVTLQGPTPNRLPLAAVALLLLTGLGLAGCGEGRAQKPVAAGRDLPRILPIRGRSAKAALPRQAGDGLAWDPAGSRRARVFS